MGTKRIGTWPYLTSPWVVDAQTHLFVSFRSLLFTFWETSHSTLFHCYSNGPSCGLGLPSHLSYSRRREGYYHNPSFGLVTKARGLQGCEPKGSPEVTSHAPGSVGRCEGVNLHIPKAIPTSEMESRWTPESSKGNCRGQNSIC